jgi:transposase
MLMRRIMTPSGSHRTCPAESRCERHVVARDRGRMAERFRRGWVGWVHSSEGFSVRLLGRTSLQCRDDDGQLRVSAEVMSKPWTNVVVHTGSIPDEPSRPGEVVVERLLRAFERKGWRLIREDARLDYGAGMERDRRPHNGAGGPISGGKTAAQTWAVEGARGVGLGLAQRLAAEGEKVVNVSAKLSARVRALGGGSGRKTDDTDAYAIAVAGLRGKNLELVQPDDVVTVLKLLSDRRQQLVEQRIAAVNRLHQLLQELLPGGASRRLTAKKARELLSTIRPRETVAKARKQLALEHVDDVENLDAKLKAMQKRIAAVLDDNPTAVQQIRGLGAVTTALILGEVGDVRSSRARRTSPATPAPHPSTPAAATTSGTRSTAAATAGSTTPSTSPRSSRSASTAPAATTTCASEPPALAHRHQQQAVRTLGRSLRRRGRRRRQDRPARPPRRSHRALRRELPAQRPRPRPRPTSINRRRITSRGVHFQLPLGGQFSPAVDTACANPLACHLVPVWDSASVRRRARTRLPGTGGAVPDVAATQRLARFGDGRLASAYCSVIDFHTDRAAAERVLPVDGARGWC